MDFKVSYLDAGFATSYFDSDCSNSSTAGPKLNHRRYKTQLRDFLSSCRTKRKPLANDIYADTGGFGAYPSPTMYTGGGTLPGYPSPADTSLYMQQNLAAPTYQSLYPGVDNRYLAATDYFTAAAGYRSLGSYYPDYAAHAALGNGYLDSGRIHSLAYDQKLAEADKLYGSAYGLSDPRLCGSLRIPADNKNGKDHGVREGKLVVKEEGGLHPEYSLPHHDAAYTLPEQIQGVSAPVLYMCPDSPKLHYDPRAVHSPSLRLTSPAESPRTGELASGLANSPTISSSCCTFSLSDICGVAAISTDSVSMGTQEVQTAALRTSTHH